MDAIKRRYNFLSPPQIYLDVDCSKITSASPVSASISTAMAAVDADMAREANRAKEDVESWCDSCRQNTLKHISPLFIKFVFLVRFLLRLATREGSLAYSLLDKMDPAKVTMDEIKEAFCRDVDNLDLKPQVRSLSLTEMSQRWMLNIISNRKLWRLKTRGRTCFVTQCHLLPVL